MLSPFPGFAMVPSAAVSVMLWVPTSWYISGFCMFLHHSRRYTLCRINAIVSPWATVSHREPPWVRVSEILPSGLYSLCSTEVNLQTKRSLNKTCTFDLVSHSIQSTCPGSLCLHIMCMYVYYIYIHVVCCIDCDVGVDVLLHVWLQSTCKSYIRRSYTHMWYAFIHMGMQKNAYRFIFIPLYVHNMCSVYRYPSLYVPCIHIMDWRTSIWWNRRHREKHGERN